MSTAFKEQVSITSALMAQERKHKNLVKNSSESLFEILFELVMGIKSP